MSLFAPPTPSPIVRFPATASTPAGLFRSSSPPFTVVMPVKVFAAGPPNCSVPGPLCVSAPLPEITPVIVIACAPEVVSGLLCKFTAPPKRRLPEAAFQVWPALSTRLLLMVFPAVLPFAMPPLPIVKIPAPPSTNACAVLPNESPATVRFAASCGVSPAAPSKISVSPATGTCDGLQLSRFETLLSPAAPVHVSVVGCAPSHSGRHCENSSHAIARKVARSLRQRPETPPQVTRVRLPSCDSASWGGWGGKMRPFVIQPCPW